MYAGEKPHKCSFENCGYSAARLDTLTQHLRTHTGIKPYCCTYEQCGYKSTQLGNLKKHIKTHNPLIDAENKKRKRRAVDSGAEVDATTATDAANGTSTLLLSLPASDEVEGSNAVKHKRKNGSKKKVEEATTII